MKSRNKYISLAIIIVLALSLAACERSASPAPQEPLATPDASGMEGVEFLITPNPDETGGLTFDQDPTSEAEPTADGEQPVEEAPPTEESAPVIEAQPLVEIARPASYTLQKGEFPYCIARRFNVAISELMTLNGLSAAQSRSLQPGLVLQIPQTGAPFPGTRALRPHPDIYTVVSGDNIYSIACKYGSVAPENIANQNGLVPPYMLTPGQTLNIP